MKEKPITGYVIVKPGWEYNDEIYYNSSNCTIDPNFNFIYTNEKDAQKALEETLISEWSNQNIAEYGYGIDEILSDVDDFGEKELKIFIEEIGGEWKSDDWSIMTPTLMKIEDIRFIEEKVSFSFAYITEVEII